MTQQSEVNSSEVWAKWLSRAACAGWLLSLALPAFMVNPNDQPLLGLQVLLIGLLFGWYVGGWAAYANIFFAVAVILLLSGRRARYTIVAMLALAATIPFFRGAIIEEGSGTLEPVVSWGWGAVLWVLSLVLLGIAAGFRGGLFLPAGAKRLSGLLLACLALVGAPGIYQRLMANEQERASTLAPGMAFTMEAPCGVALTTADAPRLPPGTVVTLDIDPALVKPGAEPVLTLPTLFHYQEGAVAWITHHDPAAPGSDVKLRIAATPLPAVLQARKTPEGAVLRLLRQRAGPVLYEQRLKATTSIGGRARYCPLPAGSGKNAAKLGYDIELLRAAGQAPASPSPAKLADEIGRIPCSLGEDDEDGVAGLRSWDGRQVILQPASIRTRPGFCSASYIVLTYVSEHSASGPSDLSPVGMVYDRKTLRPLASFNDGRVCRSGRCPEAPRDLVTGFRLSGKELVLETAAGDLVAQRTR